MHTLSELAEKGDQRAITEVAARLEHEDWPVWLAVCTLAQLAENNDRHATTEVPLASSMKIGLSVYWLVLHGVAGSLCTMPRYT